MRSRTSRGLSPAPLGAALLLVFACRGAAKDEARVALIGSRWNEERIPDSLADPAGAVIGKARVGPTTREVLALPEGSSYSADLPAAARGLEFGVAWRGPADRGCRLRVDLAGAGEARPLTELEPGAPGEATWRDYGVALPATTAPARLTFSHACPESGPPLTRGSAGALALVSNPEVVVAAGRRAAPDIVLLSMDTVGLGAFDEAVRRGMAPHLDALGRRGVRFTNARTVSSVTSIAHASMLTGRRPGRAGVLRSDLGRVTPPTVAERLRAAGYATTAITGGVLVSERLGFDRGFAAFSQEDSLFRKGTLAKQDIDAIAARATQWLERRRAGPRFLFLHTYEAHTPYVRTPPYDLSRPWQVFMVSNVAGRAPLAPEGLGGVIFASAPGQPGLRPVGSRDALRAITEARETQIEEIGRIDRHLGPVLDRALEQGGIVMVTSDHGEAFYEHGLVEHGLLEPSNLRVPLLMAGPGIPPAGSSTGPASLLDVAPTLLALAGLAAGDSMDGRSLVTAADGGIDRVRPTFAFTNLDGFAWQGWGRSWLQRSALAKEDFARLQLFDDVGDPGEAADLLSRGEEPPAELVAWATATVSALPGLHLDLSPLAGRELEIDISRSGLDDDSVHAFDLAPISPFIPGARSRRARCGPRGALWLIADELASGGEIVLKDLKSGESCRLDSTLVQSAAREPQRALCAALLWRGLRLSRGSEPVRSRDDRAIDAEDTARLRALGYLQ